MRTIFAHNIIRAEFKFAHQGVREKQFRANLNSLKVCSLNLSSSDAFSTRPTFAFTSWTSFVTTLLNLNLYLYKYSLFLFIVSLFNVCIQCKSSFTEFFAFSFSFIKNFCYFSKTCHLTYFMEKLSMALGLEVIEYVMYSKQWRSQGRAQHP